MTLSESYGADHYAMALQYVRYITVTFAFANRSVLKYAVEYTPCCEPFLFM